MSLFTIAADRAPECLRRDGLTSRYFPGTSPGMLTVVVVLCAIFALTSFNRLNHTELWAHLSFGRWISQHREWPTYDPLSAAPGSTPVLHGAWLSQLIGYSAQEHFGNEGLVFGHAILVTLAAAVLMLAVTRRGLPLSNATFAGGAMFVLNLPIVGTIRPELFGQLGAALILLACSELPTRRHPLFWLPIVGMLWANLHGSILMGVAILACSGVGSAYRVLQERPYSVGGRLKDGRILTMAAAFMLLIAGACINPHGPLLLPRILFIGEHAGLCSISEWKAMTPLSLTGVLLIGSLFASTLLWKYGNRKWELHEYLLLALFALATWSATEMLAWWAIVWPWVMAPHAASLWTRIWASDEAHQPVSHSAAMRTLIAMGCVFATAIIAPPTYSLVTGIARGEAAITVAETPVHLADQVCRLDLTGNVAAPVDWADYVVYQSGGQLKPMVDMQLADPQALEDYRRVFGGHDAWLEILRNHQMHYLLLSKSRSGALASKVAAANRSQPARVRILYQDQRGMIVDLR
jgi:hypothetical protein